MPEQFPRELPCGPVRIVVPPLRRGFTVKKSIVKDKSTTKAPTQWFEPSRSVERLNLLREMFESGLLSRMDPRLCDLMEERVSARLAQHSASKSGAQAPDPSGSGHAFDTVLSYPSPPYPSTSGRWDVTGTSDTGVDQGMEMVFRTPFDDDDGEEEMEDDEDEDGEDEDEDLGHFMFSPQYSAAEGDQDSEDDY